jgi:DNA ligase-1
LIRRGWRTFLWSRGEDLISETFPEIAALGALIGEGTAIDGEVLTWRNGAPLPFAHLQRRLGRKAPGARIVQEVPAALLAYDLLEFEGRDIREWPLEERREKLRCVVERVGAPDCLILSPKVVVTSWEEAAAVRADARSRGVEGFMLKRHGSIYHTGRRRGDWWKWKVVPFAVDAVLIYAQRGSGKRASLYTDYTFGIWQDGKLVPFAKAYTGLTDAEIRRVDSFVRRNTLERFGPVRTVKPELVFEIAFEGVQRSTRHKIGLSVRFPRINRFRNDKKPHEADTFEALLALLPDA